MTQVRPTNHPSNLQKGLNAVALMGLSFAIVFSAFYVVRQLWVVDLPAAGNVWKQGDWLINHLLVDVRRGLVGSAIIALADLLGTNPLTVVVWVQSGLVVLLYGLLLRAVTVLDQPVLLAILILCPALFVVAWPADPQGSVRKDLLAYVAILLTLWGINRDRAIVTVLGGLAMGIAVYGNEANVLFMPLFLGLFWICRGQYRRGHLSGLILGGALASHALWYALTHLSLVDTGPVCAPLLERGLAPNICDGAITWLQDNTDVARSRIAEKFGSVQTIGTMALVYLGALIPVIFAALHLRQWRLMMGLVILTALPFLPLYFVGLDWGRWLGMHVFSVVVLVMAGLGAGRLTVARNPSFLIMVVFIAAALMWAPNHEVPGIQAQWFRGVLWHLFGDIF